MFCDLLNQQERISVFIEKRNKPVKPVEITPKLTKSEYRRIYYQTHREELLAYYNNYNNVNKAELAIKRSARYQKSKLK